jgi:hypothetical protein
MGDISPTVDIGDQLRVCVRPPAHPSTWWPCANATTTAQLV